MSGNFEESQAGLWEDFYAECGELIESAREVLGHLRRSAPDQGGDHLESFFRNVHSLKGNCAIVGLRSGEELAHGTEAVLQRILRQQARIGPEDLEVLADALDAMEALIRTHQSHGTPPSTAGILNRLACCGGAEPAARAESPLSRAEGPVWICRFRPSAERDTRGVNINSVRTRLQRHGTIRRASPSRLEGGGIEFVFEVAFDPEPTAGELVDWENDGISIARPGLHADRPAGEPTASAQAAPIVRVDLSKLDDLMRITGELFVHRSRLKNSLEANGEAGDVKDVLVSLDRSLRELRQTVSRVRLVPMGESFARLPHAVRDLMMSSPKRARVVEEGQQTEVDKYLVERLREPLLHLVRNAFTHGVETPDERRASGKGEEATIVLRAVGRGQMVDITVSDDGRGIDFAAVARRAAALGLPVPESLDAANVLALLCHSGLSTRAEADRAAGRGVGMAVVAATLRELGGSLTLETQPGRGTTFRLRVPLTLSIVDALIVTVGENLCAVPHAFVEEIVESPIRDVRAIQGTPVVNHRGGLLPFTDLRSRFGIEAGGREKITLLVIGTDRGAVGLAVDRALTQREIVVRPLKDPLVQTPGFSGATELGDGHPILVLDPLAFTDCILRPAVTTTSVR